MAARLKVFRYSDGFHAWTVAASSRAKALAAWGVKRDLFKDGAAEEVSGGPDHDAALKAPGELIERGLAVDVGRIARSKAAKPSARDTARRTRIAAIEAEIAQLDHQNEADQAALEKRRRALEAEAAAQSARYDAARQGLKARLKKARDATR
jgi:hypothetical protein